ncbi:MAG: RNA polymerase sigma factor [Chitinophagales bacterium]|nr:RNA polymerase sigma factor [Chitinophagales bacterium]
MSASDFSYQVNTAGNSLFGIAYNLTQNAEDARDLIQDTIYKALVNRDKFMKGTNLKAWLYTIMRNIFINNYRRNVKRRLISEETKSEMVANIELHATHNGGETSLVMKEIERALADIDEAIRIPFLMHYRGFKYEEIAAEMQIPLGTVKSRIFFARKELQRRLKRS